VNYPDLNLSAIAAICHVTPTHLSRILNGLMRPSVVLAERIAAVLGWPIQQVLELYHAYPREQPKPPVMPKLPPPSPLPPPVAPIQNVKPVDLLTGTAEMNCGTHPPALKYRP
jgi:hypothetical protein